MASEEGKGFSIFARSLIVFFLVVIFVSGALTVIFYFFSKTTLEKNAQELISQQFEALSYRLNSELKNELLKNLEYSASSSILDSYLMSNDIEKEVSARAVERYFLQFLKHSNSFESVAFIDRLGQEKIKVGRTGRIKVYQDLSSGLLFNKIRLGSSIFDVEGPYAKGDEVLFSIGIQKIDADIGRFGGMVLVVYNLRDWFKNLSRIKIQGENPVWVFGPNEEIFMSPQKKNITFDPRPYFLKGIQDRPILKTFDKGMLAYQDLTIVKGKSLVRIAVAVSSYVLFQDVQRTGKFFLIVFFLALVVIFFISYYYAGFLSHPIVGLAQATLSIAKGDLSSRVSMKADGELGVLIDNFNRMAANLQETTISKEYIDNIINSMTDPLIVIAADFRIININHGVCDLLSYGHEELLGKDAGFLFGDQNILKDFSSKLNERGFVSGYETNYKTKTGLLVPILLSGSIMEDKNNKKLGVVLVAKDITDRKKAEERLKEAYEKLQQAQSQLIRSEKMAALGRLAADVAHEVNNPLMIISGTAEMTEAFELDKNVRAAFETIREQCGRASDILRRLLKFSRPAAETLKATDINSLLERVVVLVENQFLLKNININKSYHRDLPLVLVEEKTIEEVVLNLLNNARDAIVDRGVIEIRTMREGEYVRVDVKDSGVGMDQETLVKIFDPFFTTKDKGTGLGLSIAYNVIQRHDGVLKFSSIPGKGSVATFTLPILKKQSHA